MKEAHMDVIVPTFECCKSIMSYKLVKRRKKKRVGGWESCQILDKDLQFTHNIKHLYIPRSIHQIYKLFIMLLYCINILIESHVKWRSRDTIKYI